MIFPPSVYLTDYSIANKPYDFNEKKDNTESPYVPDAPRHGCLWLILFGIYYVIWTMIRWMIGLLILVLFDWWIAIIKAIAGKGYTWKCKRWFSPWRRTYYCPDCGYNFRG